MDLLRERWEPKSLLKFGPRGEGGWKILVSAIDLTFHKLRVPFLELLGGYVNDIGQI